MKPTEVVAQGLASKAILDRHLSGLKENSSTKQIGLLLGSGPAIGPPTKLQLRNAHACSKMSQGQMTFGLIEGMQSLNMNSGSKESDQQESALSHRAHGQACAAVQFTSFAKSTTGAGKSSSRAASNRYYYQ